MRLPSPKKLPVRHLDWKTFAGLLAMIAALALSLPGVQIARADEEVAVISVDLVDSAPSCEPSSKTTAERSTTVYLESTPNQPGATHPIALNTQGYSYRPPNVDPEARLFEQH